MCLFFPLVLGLMAAVWALPVDPAVALGWDALLGSALTALVLRLRRAPDSLGGVPLARLAGLPCPSCGSTETEPWMTGRTPLGIRCRACGRRTPGLG